MTLETPPDRKDEHALTQVQNNNSVDNQDSHDQLNQHNDVDDSPKFGRLLIVLLLAVILIVIITFATEAYHRT
jgi:hypothetical protein